jgi:hypothetical protein
MLNLKKQSIGVGLMSLGFLAQASIGGYYERNKRKRVEEPEYGGLKLFGMNVPRWLVHSPVLETLQLGATLAHVYQDPGKKGGDLPAASWEAFKGLMGEIPFIDQIERVDRGVDQPTVYAGENVRDAFLPPDLQRYAKTIDPVQGQSRKPEGFVDAIKLGIPHKREEVAVRGLDGLTLDSKLAIFEHATEKERKDYGLREKILDSHWEEGVDALPKSLQKDALARIERVRQSPAATHGLEFASNADGTTQEIPPKEYLPAEQQFRAHRAGADIGKIEKSLRGAFESNGLEFVEKEIEKHRDELGPDVSAEVEIDEHGNEKLVLHGLKARRDALAGKANSAP